MQNALGCRTTRLFLYENYKGNIGMYFRFIFAVVLLTVGYCSLGFASETQSTSRSELSQLDGEWIYVADRTEGRTPEQMGPPMSSKFSMRVEDGGAAVVLNGHGSGHQDVRIALDGSVTEIKEPKTISRYSGNWKDKTFSYEVSFERLGNPTSEGIKSIKRSFLPTPDGLVVTVSVDPKVVSDSTGVYRQAKDIEMPTPAKASIGELGWLSGAWVGTRNTGAINEERWSPPLGGAMLAVSRSVNTSGKMFAFEYLRVVERDGGLVYVAQPGGKPPTEFVLIELTKSRAIFANPRHDYPKRIVYELSENGMLSTTVGYMIGGTPRRSEYTRESD